VIAPRRADRPGARATPIEPATAGELETCPFCAGREGRTPPETLALPPREPPDTPGWRVRVVPNLYPAFERQEVVVHSPRHVRSLAELEEDEVALVAEAWQRRAHDVAGPYLHALVNEGRSAGASLAHSHSQLVWMTTEPPAVARERGGSCRLCALVAQELAEGERIVVERDGAVMLCPRAGRGPYELLIGPRAHEVEAFASEGLAGALELLRDGVRRVRAVEGPIPWNAWLHTGTHWHLEVVPRLTVHAGIELGAGIYVNPLPPEQAAEALRGAAS
jgi:UDPglucose--hexose-1-phosphate uridylyltransferase